MHTNYPGGRILLFLLPLIMACGSARHGKQHDTLPGTWQQTPVIVDGDSKDWPAPYPNYDAKSMVAYATSNDGRNLYVTMETGDEMTQIKILRQGMTLCIDTNGHHDPELYIHYPMENDNEPLDLGLPLRGQLKGLQEHTVEKKLGEKVSKNAAFANQYSLEGFGNCDGGFMITQVSPCGIRVMARMDEYKELVWEAMIPFKAIFHRDSITAADAGRPIAVCFALKGFKHTDSKSNDKSSSDMNSNNMSGGLQSNAMRGGGAGPGRNMKEDPMQRLYDNSKTWKVFGIAYSH